MGNLALAGIIWSAAFSLQPSYAQVIPDEFVPSVSYKMDQQRVCHDSIFSARFTVCLRIEHYEVTGYSRPELRREMREHGPEGNWALTYTNAKYRINDFGQCEFWVDNHIVMPRLRITDHPPATRAGWEKLYAQVLEHEMQHHQFAIEEAWESFERDCLEADRLEEIIQRRHDEFDAVEPWRPDTLINF
jgi:hypothetical protein